MTVLLGKEQGVMLYRHCIFGRSDPERGGAKICSDIQIRIAWPKDRLTATCRSSTHANSFSPMDLLSESLRRIDDQESQSEEQRSLTSKDGYGFRKSGISTPASISDGPHHSQSAHELVPDPNGLGWPGVFRHLCYNIMLTHGEAKSTISRLNASAEEKAAREKKMTFAVRTILECIGEDPDREGLLRTPERYAQAIMWMTKGYEERLAGDFHCHLFFFPKHAIMFP